MTANGVALLVITGSAALVQSRFCLVMDANITSRQLNAVAVSVDGSSANGVARASQAAGGYAPVQLSGVARVEVSGTVDISDPIATTSAGLARKAVIGVDFIAGYAVSSSRTGNPYIDVLLSPPSFAAIDANGHLVGSAASASISINSGFSIGSSSVASDSRGTIDIITNALGGVHVSMTVTFHVPYAVAPHAVLTPLNSASASIGFYVSGIGATFFDVASVGLTAAGVPLRLSYHVLA
jgi:hypothetical protein